MSTLCKSKKKRRCKKRNFEIYETTATHQCRKCKRLSPGKKPLCKPGKR